VTQFMEELQRAYVSAVAASAGCIPSNWVIDDGVDVTLSHRSAEHTISGGQARIDIQMKATSAYIGVESDHVSAHMTGARYNEFACVTPHIPRIVVILSMPGSQELWTAADHNTLSISHCAYWVNLAGQPLTTQTHITVSAPKSQILDDISLCAIMQRVGSGGQP